MRPEEAAAPLPPDSRKAPSFAVRVSVVLAVAGVLAVWTPAILWAVGAIDSPSDEVTMADNLAGLAMVAGVTMHILGMSVIFAAPRGRRKGGFLLNAGLLAAFVVAIVVLATLVSDQPPVPGTGEEP